jgi:protein tyrosine phosphatase
MRIEKLIALIPDEEWRGFLGGPEYTDALSKGEEGLNVRLERDRIITRLFMATEPDKAIFKTLDLLANQTETFPATRARFLQSLGYCVLKYGKGYGLSVDAFDKIVRVCAVSLFDPAQVVETITNSTPSADLFPEHWCVYDLLVQRAEQLQRHPFIGRSILHDFKSRGDRDLQVLQLTTLDAGSCYARPPYDQTRSGRDLPGVFFDGTDIETSLQNLMIFACPLHAEEARSMFEAIIHKGVRVIVGLAEHRESNVRFCDFWEQRQLDRIPFRHGISVRNEGSAVLAQDRPTQWGPRPPTVIEHTLRVKGEGVDRTITYLHFDGWVDNCPVPREDFLELIYERIELYGLPPKVPIAFHCMGGVGRSATAAVGFYLRRLIDRERLRGFFDVINIPQIIYCEFRRRRAGAICKSFQLATIYSLAARYYASRAPSIR